MSRLWDALSPLLDPDGGPLSMREMQLYLDRYVGGCWLYRRRTLIMVRQEARRHGVAASALLRCVEDHDVWASGWPVIARSYAHRQRYDPDDLAALLTVATGLPWDAAAVLRIVPTAERAHGYRWTCLEVPHGAR